MTPNVTQAQLTSQVSDICFISKEWGETKGNGINGH